MLHSGDTSRNHVAALSDLVHLPYLTLQGFSKPFSLRTTRTPLRIGWNTGRTWLT